MDHVIWHDVECGSYAADLPLWRELAGADGGPVLDVGAGTGRVTLDLAARGIEVHALDVDAALLEALADRARERGLGALVHTHTADARAFDLGRTFGLVIAPMQTVQLLGGPAGRAGFLACARRHLRPGGLLACAIAHDVDVYDQEIQVPVPDLREVDGVVYQSRPVAVRDEGAAFVLERLRERVSPDGAHTVTEDRIRLDHLTAAELEREARAHGLTAVERREIPETDDHVGSEVAMLRG
jgi:SAM-dependent methyltransferase